MVDVNNSANNVSEVFTPDDNEAGPFTRALTAPRKGTYRFEVGLTAHLSGLLSSG